jgi:hypothetical protein
MTASNQIFLVIDAGTPVAAFMARREMQTYRSVGARRSLTRWFIRSGASKGRQS